MFIPENPTNLPAGEYPAVLRAACEVCQVKPDELMGWTVRPDEVSIVLPAGQKVKFPIEGKWATQLSCADSSQKEQAGKKKRR